MDIFQALAEPTRRNILEMLARNGELPASEIYIHFKMSPPAVSQHLKILREANLVQMEKQAQQRIYKINVQPMLEMEDWIKKMTTLWNERFDALDKVLQQEKRKLLQISKKNNMADSNGNVLTIVRTFDAPRELVWKMWSEPEMMKKWFGPATFTCPVANIDLRVGGKSHSAMQDKDGKKYWSTGTYKEIIPLEKIVVTDSFSNEKGEIVSAEEYGMKGFPMELLVTITFEEISGGKTKMTLRHEGIKDVPADIRSSMDQSWNESFDKMTNAL